MPGLREIYYLYRPAVLYRCLGVEAAMCRSHGGRHVWRPCGGNAATRDPRRDSIYAVRFGGRRIGAPTDVAI